MYMETKNKHVENNYVTFEMNISIKVKCLVTNQS